LLESYIDSFLYKKVSENQKNDCTSGSLPKIAKTSFRVDCPLDVNSKVPKHLFPFTPRLIDVDGF
jgi:hypothetical protein